MKGEEIILLGFVGREIGLALSCSEKLKLSGWDKNKIKYSLNKLKKHPENFIETIPFIELSEFLISMKEKEITKQNTKLLDVGVPLKIFGKEIIEEGAIHQMHMACKLPISYKGALMPDGHQGYGLSIGGVLATEEAVIPYGVGVDIGCRMALTVYPLRDMENNSELSKAIDRCTIFGAGQERKRSDNLNKYIDDEVVQRDIFNTTNLLRGLKEKAARQLGTSGSGNHFVEFGLVKFGVDDLLPAGKYMGLLTHSGSRGLGARIADYYTKAAKRLRKLDPEVANLAWLMMDEEEGMEYWEAMNLAGDYAKACHDAIHTLVAKVIKETPLVKIENHHNFAWRENHDGKDLIVHRKGATPAGKGVMGIIPGSMATAGYVVRGRGHAESLHSASHGAGRLMSRTKAKQSFIWSDVKEDLTNKHITLMGAGLDECSGAYKDINAVMGYQTDLVDIVASFMPKIVKMAGADEEPED